MPNDLQLARCLRGVMEWTLWPLHYFHWLSGEIVNERVGVLVQGFFILERMLHGGGIYTKVRVQFEHLLSLSRHPWWRAATHHHSLSCIRQSVFNSASRQVFEVPADTWQILAFWRRNANSNWMNLLKTLYTQDFRDKTTRELIQSFQ